MNAPPPHMAHFLGPNSENEAWLRQQLDAVLEDWFRWRRERFPGDPATLSADELAAAPMAAEREKVMQGLDQLVVAWRDEIPTYTPRYIGHMVSDFALPALLGHLAALVHNPNICSKEAGRVGVAIETEAVAALARMIGFDTKAARGHFTSGGTVANLEAVWRARYRLDHRLALALTLAEEHGHPLDLFAAAHRTPAAAKALAERYGVTDAAMRERSGVLNNPIDIAARLSHCAGRPYRGPVILAPGHRHYSWLKAANLFGLGEDALWSIPLDAEGRLSTAGLVALIDRARDETRPVLLTVSVTGTTELGVIDPVDQVADHLERRKALDGVQIWHHVDGAYGGYFCTLAANEPRLAPARRAALAAIRRADSVTIDPHKLGYTPYACGAILARDADADRISSFAAPYVERSDLGVAVWNSTLEGSRGATGAAAVWLMDRSLGFTPEGLGGVVASTLQACQVVRKAICAASSLVRPLDPTDANIFCFSVAHEGEPLSEANRRTAAVHAAFARSPSFSLSRTVLSADSASALIDAHVRSYGGVRDADTLTLVRCVTMNPFWASEAVRLRLIPELQAVVVGAVSEALAPAA